MSWLRNALNITTAYDDSYYTAVDPGDFYEWRFTQSIPKGTIFTKKLPPTEIFTKGFIIATARIPSGFLNKSDFGFETNNAVATEIMLQAGQVQSPMELIQRYYDIQQKFAVGLDRFKKASSSRMYFISDDDLYKIGSTDVNTVEAINYGKISEIIEQLKLVQNNLRTESLKKHGRSHEMERVRRFENAMTFIENNGITVDSSKIDLLLNMSKASAQNRTKLSWELCYTKLVPEGKQNMEMIKRYQSLGWVKATLDMLQNRSKFSQKGSRQFARTISGESHGNNIS